VIATATLARRTPAGPFFTAEVARLSGAHYQQLDYWDRIGRLCPEIEARGSGSRRGYSLDDLVLATLLVRLRRLGVSHRLGARIVDFARDHWPDVVVVLNGWDLRGVTVEVAARMLLDGGGLAVSLEAIRREVAADIEAVLR
jgi:hypothetical protein